VSLTILLTGAARGLGLSLVEALLEGNHRVFAGRRGPSPELDALEARSAGRLVPLALDVTDSSAVRAAAARVATQADGLDVVVNNAAVLPEAGRGTLEETDVDVGRYVYDVNGLGPLRVTQAFLPLLRSGKRRLIVNVSSEAGSIADCWRKDDFLYCMSKAALNMQSAILKNSLGPEGFSILSVHPGWLRTDMGGPNADLDPRESALALRSLIETPRAADAPIYVDHTGKQLRW
jgi:NAD(P)-dependent dehydrogenase (short-subunit alcohol dehydrogenase family)